MLQDRCYSGGVPHASAESIPRDVEACCQDLAVDDVATLTLPHDLEACRQELDDVILSGSALLFDGRRDLQACVQDSEDEGKADEQKETEKAGKHVSFAQPDRQIAEC